MYKQIGSTVTKIIQFMSDQMYNSKDFSHRNGIFEEE